jgi:hypothetical protein
MKKRYLPFVFIFCCIALIAEAQVTEEWVHRINGPAAASGDQAHSVGVDPFGNVFVTGHIQVTASNYDYQTVKYSPSGSVLWSRTYSGAGDHYGYLLVPDDSGNVYVTGYGPGTGSHYDIHTIKYNANGDSVWVRRYNTAQNWNEYGYWIDLDNQGNIFVAGSTNNGLNDGAFILLKYNPSGQLLWARTYNGPGAGIDYAYAVDMDNAGNSYITGISHGAGSGYDCVTVKYSPSGDSLWVKRYNGTDNADDYCYSIAVDGAGNSYITGSSDDIGINSVYLTIKYSPSGTEEWVRKYNGIPNGEGFGFFVTVDNSNNAVVTGATQGNGTGFDCTTIKYRPNGDSAWTRRFDGPGSSSEIILNVVADASNNYYVSGSSTGAGTGLDVLTLKYDSAGVQKWAQLYSGPGNDGDGSYQGAVDNMGNVYVACYSAGSGTGYDWAAIKYSQLTGVQQVLGNVPGSYKLSQNYPNPFNPVTNISFDIPENETVKLAVYDISGKEIAVFVNESLNAGTYNYSFNGTALASGVYYYRVEAGGFTETKKMTLIK